MYDQGMQFNQGCIGLIIQEPLLSHSFNPIVQGGGAILAQVSETLQMCNWGVIAF